MYKFFRQVLVTRVLLGLVFALPYLGYAATVNDQISLDTDDADQDGIGSTTQLFSSPHALGQNRHNGYRFTGHGLPDNTFILNATIQFTTEIGNSSGSPSTRIVGEDADNAGTFVEQTNDISNRPTTSASVVWNIPGWPTDGESGPLQRTPNIATVVQEIVDRPGWTSGNPLVFVLEPNGGDDTRNAWSFDGNPGDSAALSIEYTLCPGGVVTTTTDSGRGSLRECINYVNDGYGTTITFNIPGPGNRSSGGDTWWGIALASPLPSLNIPATVIDGTTQTTNRGDTNSRGPEIELDGTGAGVGANGLVVGGSATGSTIRGLAIGNFSDNGILLLGGSNTVAGNYLGLSADGDTVAPNNPSAANQLGGIRVESASNTIGGVAAADRNVASGNGFAGIDLVGAGASGNMVYGNYVGVDATGTVARANTQEGVDIDLANSNSIGGPGPGQRNIISGNDSDGIEIDGGDFNIVQGNYIGTDVTGTFVIANGRDGIDINNTGVDGATNNLIGGSGANEGNLIRGNTLNGVQIRGADSIDNAVLGNQIYGNVAFDIDLDNNDDITVNDPLDADSGSNDILNYPVITSATETGGTLTVNFDLDVPAGNYRIEFFTNASGPHPSGNGGGEIFADATTIAHGGGGVQSFVHAFAGSVGDIITATATEEAIGPLFSSTSEFSTAVTATLGSPFSSSRWPLDETSGLIAADIDAGNSGTYRNGVLLNQTAACPNTGNAVYFDGLDDFVEVPHIPGYLLDEGTVTLWANIDALGTVQGLFSKDSTDFDTGGHLTITVRSGGEVRVRLQSTTADNFVNSAPIAPTTWFHVAFSWGPAGMAVYVDGAPPVTDPYTGGLGVTSGGAGNFEPIAFGAATRVSDDLLVTPTSQHFAGYMDDVRIYNRALTLPEIQSLAACGVIGPAVTSAEAEIAPNDVATGSTANAFSYDIAATIGAGDTGVDRVAITVPASFGAPTVSDVQVGGVPVAFTDNTAGNAISVDLTTKVTTSSQITVLFNADAPNLQDLVGVDFLSTVDDSVSPDTPQATTEGNGDGDGGDLNSWTVTTTDPVGGFCPAAGGAASTGTTVGGTSMTISHTTSGADRLMLVGVSIGIGTAETVSGITYNGAPLSFEGARNGPGNDSRIEIWSRVAPDTGTHDVVVTLSAGTHDGATAGVMTFTEVHQTTPLGAFASNSGDSNNATTTVSSAAGELVFGVVSVDDTADYDLIPGPGQTPDRWDLIADSANGGGSTEAGAPSVVTSWTWAAGSDDWAVGGISIKPAPSCPGSQIDLVKRAFWLDGTPIPTGATIPSGVEFKYLLYINNLTIAARNDVSVRDVLDPAFVYQAGTIQVDNSVAECAVAVCTPAEEQTIFTAVDGAAFLSDATGDDVASYTGAGTSIDAGDGNVANIQLDINANAVWAILFSAKMP